LGPLRGGGSHAHDRHWARWMAQRAEAHGMGAYSARLRITGSTRATFKSGTYPPGNLSLGKKSTKTTSTSTPWAPAQPILTGAGNDILNTVQGNAGNLSNLSKRDQRRDDPRYPGADRPAGPAAAAGLWLPQLDALAGLPARTVRPRRRLLGNYAGQQAGNSINSAFSLAGGRARATTRPISRERRHAGRAGADAPEPSI
jgi:hypothetical protein